MFLLFSSSLGILVFKSSNEYVLVRLAYSLSEIRNQHVGRVSKTACALRKANSSGLRRLWDIDITQLVVTRGYEGGGGCLKEGRECLMSAAVVMVCVCACRCSIVMDLLSSYYKINEWSLLFSMPLENWNWGVEVVMCIHVWLCVCVVWLVALGMVVLGGKAVPSLLHY